MVHGAVSSLSDVTCPNHDTGYPLRCHAQRPGHIDPVVDCGIEPDPDRRSGGRQAGRVSQPATQPVKPPVDTLSQVRPLASFHARMTFSVRPVGTTVILAASTL